MRRTNSQISQRSLSQSDISSNLDEQQQQISIDSTSTGTLRQSTNSFVKGKNKRKSKGCKCRGDCRKKRCGCNSVNKKCSITCACTDKCKNRETPLTVSSFNESSDETQENVIIEESDDGEKSANENTFKFKSPLNQNAQIVDETFITSKAIANNNNTATYLTPKMAR